MTPASISRRPHLVVPLYIYPTPGAWEPLFEAARESPDVSFIVIVNPFNGPGADSLPDSSYQNALTQLSAFPNVQLLGYVYCSYGRRDIVDVQKDIAIYSGWNLNFNIAGIFFDEVSSADQDTSLMASLSHFTRSTWNQTTGRSGFVVYNPGVAVGEAFYRNADLIVAFEQSEHQWQNRYLRQNVPTSPIQTRAKDIAIIHSCVGDATSLARQVAKMGLGGIYLTEQSGGGYTHWPKSWFEVIHVLGQALETKQ
ncbi:Spherulation-specific family 4 [Fusarium heterosporum]|uniref:Spherulation-specific family 4 n=1 Tax=Fusarium heterosporum TaxID=42747 RepID=A0A8H5T3K1_FUSHE|nr:Spherulation-specific family 4 [Fusarium heterosporum]